MAFKAEKYHYHRKAILEGLPEKELSMLRAKMERHEAARGTVLFTEGSFPRGVYFLHKGLVKIYQTNEDDKENILLVYTKGESFGYRPILSREANPVSAKTLTECSFSFIPTAAFLKVLNKSSVLPNKLLRALSRDYSAWANKNSLFARKKVKERVALSLLILLEKYRTKEKSQHAVAITLSRDDLASYVGAEKETVVRMLTLFKKDHIIKTNDKGDIFILKANELEHIAKSF